MQSRQVPIEGVMSQAYTDHGYEIWQNPRGPASCLAFPLPDGGRRSSTVSQEGHGWVLLFGRTDRGLAHATPSPLRAVPSRGVPERQMSHHHPLPTRRFPRRHLHHCHHCRYPICNGCIGLFTLHPLQLQPTWALRSLTPDCQQNDRVFLPPLSTDSIGGAIP